MKRILVAADLSVGSDRAISRAVQLARQHHAELRILYTIEQPDSLAALPALRRESEEMIRKLLPSYLEDEIRVGIHTPTGNPVSEIFKEADRFDADLIILGMHRHQGVKDMFVGTTAWRILRMSSRPVMVVREHASEPYGRILAALDDTAFAEDVLTLACSIAPQAEISAVHVFHIPFGGFITDPAFREETRAQRQKMVDETIARTVEKQACSQGTPVRIHGEIREDETVTAIMKCCKEEKPELMVIGTHGRKGFAHAFHGSIAEDLFLWPPCDILAIRTRKESL